MHFELNFKSGRPPYLQIVEQVKFAAASGVLRDGDQLPSIRELAEDLKVNRNTVAKAFDELEHEGIVSTEQGRGVFVTDQVSPYSRKMRQAILIQAVDAAVVQAHHFQIDDDALLDLVRQRVAEF